jgi:hypothetical protein
MTYSAKFILLQNFCKSVFNLKKSGKNFNFESPDSISQSAQLTFSSKEEKRFRRIVHWERQEIPPTYPYALLTHLQFALVNDKKFPFPPFGLIHKKECIECLAPLVPGIWNMTCRIDTYRQVDNGVEVEIVSELTIDNKLFWKSTSIAFKKTGSGFLAKKHEPISVTSDTHWKIPRYNGLAYGLVSNNVDPIHLSKFTANLMGHKQAIMHGMWTCARGLSEYKNLKYPFTVNVKFIAPIYLPAEVLYKEQDNGFGVYSLDGKRVHLLAEIS